LARKSLISYLDEVSPPGWGHTKAEKEKTKPWKPKSKIGGTAAAMKKAKAEGRMPGVKNIFALMWSMKNKGDKPHYKPGKKGVLKKKYKGPQGQNEERETIMKDLELLVLESFTATYATMAYSILEDIFAGGSTRGRPRHGSDRYRTEKFAKRRKADLEKRSPKLAKAADIADTFGFRTPGLSHR